MMRLIMEKKEYKTPEVKEYGDVKELTESGGANFQNYDALWQEADGTWHMTASS